MASAVQIPVSEYLQTTYRPDREYVDGEVLERNVGKWEHARLQALLAQWLGMHESIWNLLVSTEQRTRVTETRVRVPDLVAVRPGPHPDVLTDPPLLVIEILSPDDTYTALEERCQDYLTMGVETVWVIDPRTRTGRICRASGWVSAQRLEVPGTPIHVELPMLFGRLESPSTPDSPQSA
ncbi:Putative restriction endonuclease [Bryocella elongata]|uniref:Putative restriction endonuclease n=1 Tax=Bryocella elongata TaxID=863522 RepID=A0A1H6AHT9_9BACT|nr:Uma2 family endonuclease [Bryocella elongata]SEG48323.1 Putative restriction endonuclease [Bryocella elongata]